MDKNEKKKLDEAAQKKLTLDDLANVAGGFRIISDSDDEEDESGGQRKSRFPKGGKTGDEYF